MSCSCRQLRTPSPAGVLRCPSLAVRQRHRSDAAPATCLQLADQPSTAALHARKRQRATPRDRRKAAALRRRGLAAARLSHAAQDAFDHAPAFPAHRDLRLRQLMSRTQKAAARLARFRQGRGRQLRSLASCRCVAVHNDARVSRRVCGAQEQMGGGGGVAPVQAGPGPTPRREQARWPRATRERRARHPACRSAGGCDGAGSRATRTRKQPPPQAGRRRA